MSNREQNDRANIELGWNRQAFFEQIDQNSELLNELLDIFRHSSSQLMEKLHQGLQTRDAGAVVYAAHAIKGSAATLGINKISQLAHEVELAGRSHDLDTAVYLQPRLQNMLERFRQIK